MKDLNSFTSEETYEELTDGLTPFSWQFFGPFFGNTEAAVEHYTHCSHCGAHLHCMHSTDFVKNRTQETAKCLECGLKARNLLHSLQ